MKRLFDDPAFSPELRAELARSRRAGNDYDVDAKLPQLREAFENLQPSVSGELVPLRPESQLARLSGAQVHLLSLALKIMLVSAFVGTAVYLAWPAPLPPQDAPARAAARAPKAPSIAAPQLRVPEPQPRAPAAEPVLDETESTPPAPTARAAARSSRREIAQLVRIRALLESDPSSAYRLAQRGDEEFPRGVLSEERHALQVRALAKSGNQEAAARKAREFFARYPRSPMREQIEAALGR